MFVKLFLDIEEDVNVEVRFNCQTSCILYTEQEGESVSLAAGHKI